MSQGRYLDCKFRQGFVFVQGNFQNSEIFKISRERERLRKSSAACKSEELYKSALSSFPSEDQTGRKPGLEVVKKKIKSAMVDETSKDQLAHTKKLISRRGLLELLQTMDQDAT